IEGAFEKARSLYQDAIRQDTELFEARYGLAVLEEDAGRAPDAHAEALKAVRIAPSDMDRAAAQLIVNETAPFARRSVDRSSAANSGDVPREAVASGRGRG